MKTTVCRINIEVQDLLGVLAAENIAKDEYLDFEMDVYTLFVSKGFDLEEEHQSYRSNSHYYVFSKMTPEGDRLKFIVFLRISDHALPERNFKGINKKGRELQRAYNKKLIDELKQEKFLGVKYKNIEIIIDDEHYPTYDEAMDALYLRLKKFE